MSLLRRFRDWKDVRRWENNGRPSPPPHVIRQRVIRDFGSRYGLEILVETGTFKGDMIAAMKNDFRELYSIELAPHVHERAVQRFVCDPHITIFKGDSSKVLETLVPKLKAPTLFWLDGHYAKAEASHADADTAILQELAHIFSRPELKSVVLINDARGFLGETDQAYPSLDSVREFTAKHRPDYTFEVESDSIRLAPKI